MRFFWLCLGHILVAVGFIGIFLPVLPTTPLLLLAAACYSKGSKRFEDWLLNHKKYGPQIREWRAYRVIRPKIKRTAVTVILLSLIFPMYIVDLEVWVRVTVLLLVSYGIFFILSCPSDIPNIGTDPDSSKE